MGVPPMAEGTRATTKAPRFAARAGQILVAPDGALRDDGTMLLTCQTGYESFLTRELEDLGLPVVERGAGWVRSVATNVAPSAPDAPPPLNPDGRPGGRALPDLVFAHLALLEPVELAGDSVNALAQQVGDYFLASLQGEQVVAAWPSVWTGPHEVVGLGRRVAGVEAAFGERLRRRFSRVARLARPELPRGVVGVARGLFVHFTDFRRAFVTRTAWLGGQRRMADDPLAPSRSYLKIEEAYALLGHEPQAGEVVADLGAAPGGWSYSAAKRGARVVAVDNGPLKGGALDHPLVTHRAVDAFQFRPGAGEVFDWMFCDLVEEPHHVMRHLVAPWIEGRWCRRFVVNVKLGRVDPAAWLRGLRAADAVFSRHATAVRVRHLYHDREELTVMGEVRA
jgi:23S rRNA (cytidine2498-2'-O)-methyltransferase